MNVVVTVLGVGTRATMLIASGAVGATVFTRKKPSRWEIETLRHEQGSVRIVVDQARQFPGVLIDETYAAHFVPREITVGLFDQRRRQRRYDEPAGREIGSARWPGGAGRQPGGENPPVGEQCGHAALPLGCEPNDDPAAGQAGPGLAETADARRILFVDPHRIDENVGPLGGQGFNGALDGIADAADGKAERQFDRQQTGGARGHSADPAPGESFAVEQRLGDPHQPARARSGIEAVVHAPEQRNADFLFQHLQRAA